MISILCFYQIKAQLFCTLSDSFVETDQQRLADIVHVARGGWQPVKSGPGLAESLPILG